MYLINHLRFSALIWTMPFWSHSCIKIYRPWKRPNNVDHMQLWFIDNRLNKNLWADISIIGMVTHTWSNETFHFYFIRGLHKISCSKSILNVFHLSLGPLYLTCAYISSFHLKVTQKSVQEKVLIAVNIQKNLKFRSCGNGNGKIHKYFDICAIGSLWWISNKTGCFSTQC